MIGAAERWERQHQLGEYGIIVRWNHPEILQGVLVVTQLPGIQAQARDIQGLGRKPETVCLFLRAMAL